MKYKLPPLDETAFALALEAYRTAVQYERRVGLKWEPQMNEVRKANEFSGLHRRYENETYVAEKLREFARDTFYAAAIRGRPFPEYVYAGGQKDFFNKYVGAEAKKVVAKIRAAYKTVEKTQIREEEEHEEEK